MSKSDLITALAMMADTDPRLEELAAFLAGTERPKQDEPWLSLKEVSKRTRKHAVWLARLRVPEVCGERLAGRRSYKLGRVEDYLRSAACQERLTQLREERRAKQHSTAMLVEASA
jgi:hypothetical protein